MLIVPRDMITTGPAPGIAHGIGATSRPQSSLDMSQLQHVVPPRGKRKARPVATGPVQSAAAPAPAAAPGAAARPASRPAVPVAMDDDEIVVTEWTEGGLPQRRSRGRAPLGSHNLPQQHAAPAADPAAGGHNGHHGANGGRPGGEEPPPGLWLEAFTQAVNGVPQEPKNDEDSDDAWDKGDLK